MISEEVRSEQIGRWEGKSISLNGHVQAVRNLGNIMFLIIRDAGGQVQAVTEDPQLVETVKAISAETVVRARGTVVRQPKGERHELHLSALDVLAASSATLPVEIAKQNKIDGLSLSTMLDNRPITLRNEKVRSVFKLEAALCTAFRNFLNKQDFVEIHSPKIVATGTEGGANLFPIDYMGKKAFLAQSPQFYKQIMVGVFERVFEIGPVYRAEQHDTTRHLNEYVSMDFEMGFINSVQDVIDMEIELLRHMFDHVREHCAKELKFYEAVVPSFDRIPQLTLAEAVSLLRSRHNWKGEGNDLDPEGERLLCQHFLETEGCDLVYVTQYPLSARPFYAKGADPPTPGEPRLSHSFDLLFRGLEITTGGQRINEYSELLASMEARGLQPEDFSDYLQCFKFGMPPHGGLAIGLERLTKQLLGLPTVKLASLFPRDLNRLRP